MIYEIEPITFEINGMEFTPIPGQKYSHNYAEELRDILKNKKDSEYMRAKWRNLVLNDLFFVTYFVLKIPIANHPFWIEACHEVQHGPSTQTLDLWAREHGKAVDYNYPVLTTGGWKKHGELEVGDEVFHPNGQPNKVIALSEVFDNTECFEVEFTDGSKVTTSDNHLWTVLKKSRKRISGTKNKRHYRDGLTLSSKELSKYLHKPDNRFGVQLNEVLQFTNHKKLRLSPYVLGAWLGDGTSCCGNITTADNEIINKIESLGYKVGKNTALYRWNIYKILPTLRELEVLNNKHIPQEYLYASEDDRRELLRGLMDTDGTIDSRGVSSFTNINKTLAENVHELAMGLGLQPRLSVRSKKIKGENYISYDVRFRAYKKDEVFSLSRKQEKVPEGKRVFRCKYIKSVKKVNTIPTRCIQVASEDGLYLIGKNLITTHNSSIITSAETIQSILRNPEERICIFSYAQKPALAFFRQIKYLFEESFFLKDIFPDVLYMNPSSEAPKWSEDTGLIVKRKGYYREATLEAWGLVEGMPTGKHFTQRIYDDVETPEFVNSPEMIEKLKYMFDLSHNVGMDGDRHRVIGTTYSHNGLLQDLRERKDLDGNLLYHTRVKPATEDGTPSGKPVFLSEEKMNLLRGNLTTFFSQQLLDPTPRGEEKLNSDFILTTPPHEIPKNLYKFMAIDPAGVRKDRRGDDWAIIVFGVEPYMNDLGASKLYILDMVIDVFDEADAMKQVVDIYARNGRMLAVGVEKVGAMTFEIHISNALRAKGYYVSKEDKTLMTLSPAGRNKHSRILQNVQWPLNNGCIHVNEAIPLAYRERLSLEMQKFPHWRDDGLDALAYAFEMTKDYRFSKRRLNPEKQDKWWHRYQQKVNNVPDEDGFIIV